MTFDEFVENRIQFMKSMIESGKYNELEMEILQTEVNILESILARWKASL